MFLNYIIFMLFVQLLINYVIFTSRNVKYQFNTKYPNNLKLTFGYVKNSKILTKTVFNTNTKCFLCIYWAN